MLSGIPIGLLHKIAKGHFFIWLSVRDQWLPVQQTLCQYRTVADLEFF